MIRAVREQAEAAEAQRRKLDEERLQLEQQARQTAQTVARLEEEKVITHTIRTDQRALVYKRIMNDS